MLDDNARAGGRLRQAIDDNSLTPVPENERKSGWYLSWLPAGVATSLLQLTIAGTTTPGPYRTNVRPSWTMAWSPGVG